MKLFLIENVATVNICQVEFSVFEKIKTKKLFNGRNCRGVAQPSLTDNNCPSGVNSNMEGWHKGLKLTVQNIYKQGKLLKIS